MRIKISNFKCYFMFLLLDMLILFRVVEEVDNGKGLKEF